MTKLTQDDVDKMITLFKGNLKRILGDSDIHTAFASDNKNVVQALYFYQEVVQPNVRELGLKVPSSAELFGLV